MIPSEQQWMRIFKELCLGNMLQPSPLRYLEIIHELAQMIIGISVHLQWDAMVIHAQTAVECIKN
ncbi:hypothetical protein EV690_2579 [Celerinatantimonas diazotrophica]|uniref:Uncharacterized protein n=2 Tax=Celerinatantimonas diazotrophica TaxID=412034 RepID=A0A4R1JAB1_9GAMM|nr:hypothetical protein EV690_2579 [Celerinatantimonas diazotrophica]CAG9296834.1 hypothetical protein CEDIAZO_01993 [Celerinatantimonas diazotrophica]